MWLVPLGEVDFLILLMVINLNLNSHMWLVATIWNRIVLEFYDIEVEVFIFT